MSESAKSPQKGAGGLPRSCPTCNRQFQNSRGFHKHILKCSRNSKLEVMANDNHANSEGMCIQQDTGVQPASQQEKDGTDRPLEGPASKKEPGRRGRPRKIRQRSLSATAVAVSGSTETNPMPATPLSIPASVQTRSKSARNGKHSHNLSESGQRRKRASKATPDDEDSFEEKRQKGNPPQADLSLNLSPPKADEDRNKKRPHTRSRTTRQPGAAEDDTMTQDFSPAPEGNPQDGPVEKTSFPRSPVHQQKAFTTSDLRLSPPPFLLPRSPVLISRSTSVSSALSHADSLSPKMKMSPLSFTSVSPPPLSPPLLSPVLTDPPKSTLSPKSDSMEAEMKREAPGSSKSTSITEVKNKKDIDTKPNHQMTKSKERGHKYSEGRKRSCSLGIERNRAPVLTVGLAVALSENDAYYNERPVPLFKKSSLSAPTSPPNSAADQEEEKKGKMKLKFSKSASLSPPPISTEFNLTPGLISPPHPAQPLVIDGPLKSATFTAHDPSLEDNSSTFSIPLNQGPSMAAQSASYFLTGMPPVQGLEFLGHPPSTPHTQVFGFYPSDSLAKAKSTVTTESSSKTSTTPSPSQSQPFVATSQLSQAQLGKPSPTGYTVAPPSTTSVVTSPPHPANSTVQTPPPPPPPLITAVSNSRSVYTVTSSVPVSSVTFAPRPGQVIMSVPGKMGPYPGYAPATQPSAAGGLPYYPGPYMMSQIPPHAHHPLQQCVRTYPMDYGQYLQWQQSQQRNAERQQLETAKPKEDGDTENVSSHHTTSLLMSDDHSEFQCTQCEKYFKNKKALNGHMRKHGGAHGQKISTVIKKEIPDVPDADGGMGDMEQSSWRHPASHSSMVFTFKNVTPGSMSSSRSSSSFDALLKAAEKMKQQDEEEKTKRDAAAAVLASGVAHNSCTRKRPENISIPGSEGGFNRMRSMSPPMLSPRPSIYNILSPRSSQPSTPGIMKNRPSFDRDEDPPMIHVGDDYQADVGEYRPGNETTSDHREEILWKPINEFSESEQQILDWYMEFACSEAIPFKGRNKEYAMHVLQLVEYNIKDAIRALVTGRFVFPDNHTLKDYHYSGTSEWKPMETRLFRKAFREYKKQFDQIHKVLPSKSLKELHEYYYTWKKMKPAEYRGRQRHHSDDELTYDVDSTDRDYVDEGAPSPSSIDSSSSHSTSLSDDSSQRKTRAHRAVDKRSGRDSPAISKLSHEKSWAPLTQKASGSILGEGKFPMESPSKASKLSSMIKDSKPSGSPSTSDSPKRHKINTKTAEDRPGNYPCGFCGITFPSIKSRSAHMKKHKYEDTGGAGGKK